MKNLSSSCIEAISGYWTDEICVSDLICLTRHVATWFLMSNLWRIKKMGGIILAIEHFPFHEEHENEKYGVRNPLGNMKCYLSLKWNTFGIWRQSGIWNHLAYKICHKSHETLYDKSFSLYDMSYKSRIKHAISHESHMVNSLTYLRSFTRCFLYFYLHIHFSWSSFCSSCLLER